MHRNLVDNRCNVCVDTVRICSKTMLIASIGPLLGLSWFPLICPNGFEDIFCTSFQADSKPTDSGKEFNDSYGFIFNHFHITTNSGIINISYEIIA